MPMLNEWLKLHELEQYADIFRTNEVDLRTLKLLSDADLKELGIPFGPRKRILAALSQTASMPVPASPPPGADPAMAPKYQSMAVAAGTTAERRQLTVMFCDMVGFTSIAGQVDPELLKQILRIYEDACTVCIERYEGHLFTMLGDGVVAFFGYPTAHEAEAQRAIRAGLDILDALADLPVPAVGRLQARIGIATGIVVVAPGERNAVGETMNLAARLQAAAEPGQLLITDRVLRNAGGEFETEDLGARALKGIAEPTDVHRVTGLRQARSRFEAATHDRLGPLIGRAREVRLMLERWDDVVHEQTGHALLLSGEAGIGKSRIIDGVRAQVAQQSGAGTLLFQCQPFYANSAFYPLTSGLEQAMGLDRCAQDSARLDAIVGFVTGRCQLPPSDARFIADILSLPFAERLGAITLSPKLAKSETIRVLVAIFRALAADRPCLLLFEDLHWADPTSIDVLGALIQSLAGAPLLLVMTSRPSFDSPWYDAPHVTTLPLARLNIAESSALVDGLSGGRRLPGELASRIVAKSDGIPLFIEELTRSILESGDVVLANDNYVLADHIEDIEVPDTLRDSLTARLDRSPQIRAVGQIGAALGREFSHELIAALDLLPAGQLEDALQRLTDSGLAFVRGTPPHAVYTFKHALVQDVAYESLLKSERKALHARIAATIRDRWPELADSEPELLAHHLSAAGDAPAAAPLWLKAGRHAMQRFAVPEAIAHLHRGMKLAAQLPPGRASDETQLAMRTLLGPALVARHGWGSPEISRTLEPAWALAESLEHRPSYVPILNALWVHSMTIDRLAASMQWAGRLLHAGDALGDDSMTITGHRAAAGSCFWLGDFAGARAHGDALLKLYDSDRHGHLVHLTNTDPLTGEGIYRSQYLWMLGFPDQARAAAEATETHARRANHPFDLAFALTLGAQLWELRREPDALLRRTEEAERIGRERGVPLLSETLAEISRGIAWLQLGQHARGAAQIDLAVTRLRATGHRVWIPYLRTHQAQGLALSGHASAALAMLDDSIEQIEAGEERAHYAEVLRLRGWLLMLMGRADDAEDALRAALAVARRQQARSWELRAATTLAELLASRHQPDSARAILQPVFDWFTEGHDTHDLVAAADLLGRLNARTLAA